MQPTMLQAVGGMDHIAAAIYEQVRPIVRLNSPVTAIRRMDDRVRIEHGPGTAMTEAEFAIVTIPAVVLARIPSDFSPAKRATLSGLSYLRSVKVAFEAPRFWEAEDVFGGLAWTDRANENVIYPSHDFGAAKGALIAAYCAGWTNRDNPQKFESYGHEQRFQVCRDSIEALHPGKSRLLAKPATVAWGLTPHSEGVGALWPEGSRGAAYAELLKPEGPIVFAGEHLSYQGQWLEGAALSSHEALKRIAAMAREKRMTSA
jgi:monoamine oxidase